MDYSIGVNEIGIVLKVFGHLCSFCPFVFSSVSWGESISFGNSFILNMFSGLLCCTCLDIIAQIFVIDIFYQNCVVCGSHVGEWVECFCEGCVLFECLFVGLTGWEGMEDTLSLESLVGNFRELFVRHGDPHVVHRRGCFTYCCWIFIIFWILFFLFWGLFRRFLFFRLFFFSCNSCRDVLIFLFFYFLVPQSILICPFFPHLKQRSFLPSTLNFRMAPPQSPSDRGSLQNLSMWLVRL